ncbi:hypothetical protein GRI44_12110 [Altererythrobacter confluentis]|uniref:Uncharacterized protein n=1 Tax=Allopontixanthobacter confluentis TaxID=1849021 RepID=A0A6L7GJ12_9SPHN|nr:hypothetical protein [Allopontixanthobacter confluentis]MXP15496.1 hypothetical protein [Allopontixanthobacter confluentis]
MFGPRLNTVFASRWKAVWWSAVVLMTAYCSVPSPDKAGARQAAADSAAKDANPWALDPQ